MKTKDSYYLLDKEVKYYPATQMVHHADTQIHLTDFQHKLLMNFIAHPGVVRTQSEICEQVWPNKITTVDAFNKPLGAIRNALSNNRRAMKNHYIKTWAREGYSLCCSCEYISAQDNKIWKPWLIRLGTLSTVVATTVLAVIHLNKQTVYEAVNLRRITPLEGISAEPSLNDDGSIIAFTYYNTDGNGQILAKQLSQRFHVTLTSNHNDKMPALSPSGEQLLYQRLEHGQCQIRLISFGSNLEVVKDEQLVQCSPSSYFVSMSWHDQSAFYYTDSSVNLGPYSIYRFDLKTRLSTLYLSPDVRVEKEHNGFSRVVYQRKAKKLYIIHSPDWSNSEIRVYHNNHLTTLTTVNTAIGSIGLFNNEVIYKDNSNRLVLGSQKKSLISEFNHPIMHPVTAQNSNRLAYHVGQLYQWNIYAYDIDQKTLKQLTFNNAINRYPLKTQNDFYYTSNLTGVTQLYRQPHISQGPPTALSNFTQNRKISQVTVSKDGQLLALSDEKSTELYRLNGDSITRIKTFADQIHPTFSNDSQRLLLSTSTNDLLYSATEYRLSDFKPTGLHIADARFALYSNIGLIYAKTGQKGLYRYSHGRSTQLFADIEVFKPAHLAISDDTLYVINQADQQNGQVQQINLATLTRSQLNIKHAGQLYFHQNQLYFTLEQPGKSNIYVGEIIAR